MVSRWGADARVLFWLAPMTELQPLRTLARRRRKRMVCCQIDDGETHIANRRPEEDSPRNLFPIVGLLPTHEATPQVCVFARRVNDKPRQSIC